MNTIEQARELAADLRTRINPQYANQLGCESYLNRVCAEAIEGLIAERDALKTHNTMLRVCLKNVIKVADRKTDEFDAAKAALEKS